MNKVEITNYKDLHRGETAYLLCNGPSLRDVDLSLLKDKVTIGLNKIHKSGFTPTYLVAVSPLILQNTPELATLDTTKFIPLDRMPHIHSHDGKSGHGGTFVNINTNNPIYSFVEDASDPMWEGHTVTYVAMQIAFYMGFDKLVILGLDHDYGPLSRSNPNALARHDGIASNHFDPNYLAPGEQWYLPDLARVDIAFALARKAWERAGRQIINASAQTKCKTFPLRSLQRELYEDAIRPSGLASDDPNCHAFPAPRVTAIVSAYKASEFLPGCIEDLHQQTLWAEGQLEIVAVCQRGSAEHSYLLDSGFDSYQHQTMVVTEDVPTIYKAWELGCKAATGLYITNANCDDRHHIAAMELQADILDANPNIGLAYFDQYITWVRNQTFNQFEESLVGVELVQGREVGKPGIFNWPDYQPGILADGCMVGSQPMWRASLHQLHGHFDADMQSAGDYEFWLRIARDTDFFHIRVPLGLYLAREDGKELSDRDLSMRESQVALLRHQSPHGLMLRPYNMYTAMLYMGGEYGFTDIGALHKAATELAQDAQKQIAKAYPDPGNHQKGKQDDA